MVQEIVVEMVVLKLYRTENIIPIYYCVYTLLYIKKLINQYLYKYNYIGIFVYCFMRTRINYSFGAQLYSK